MYVYTTTTIIITSNTYTVLFIVVKNACIPFKEIFVEGRRQPKF